MEQKETTLTRKTAVLSTIGLLAWSISCRLVSDVLMNRESKGSQCIEQRSGTWAPLAAMFVSIGTVATNIALLLLSPQIITSNRPNQLRKAVYVICATLAFIGFEFVYVFLTGQIFPRVIKEEEESCLFSPQSLTPVVLLCNIHILVGLCTLVIDLPAAIIHLTNRNAPEGDKDTALMPPVKGVDLDLLSV